MYSMVTVVNNTLSVYLKVANRVDLKILTTKNKSNYGR